MDVSDLRFDLAWTSLLQRMHNGMKLRDSVIPTYETLMGLKVEQVEFFEVFAYFRRLFNSAVWFTTDSERGKMGAWSVDELSTAEGFSGMKRHRDAIKNGIRNVGRINGHASARIGKVRIFLNTVKKEKA